MGQASLSFHAVGRGIVPLAHHMLMLPNKSLSLVPSHVNFLDYDNLFVLLCHYLNLLRNSRHCTVQKQTGKAREDLLVQGKRIEPTSFVLGKISSLIDDSATLRLVQLT